MYQEQEIIVGIIMTLKMVVVLLTKALHIKAELFTHKAKE
nr:MAG TPA: hypothetical protein [Caudoviricetes sp.]